MKWNEKVLRLMSQKQMSQKDLSKASGITEASVSRYLNGDRTPRIDIIVNFAKALDTPVEFLLDEKPHKLNAFDEIATVIARNGNELTAEEKNKLIEYLLHAGDKNV